MGEKCPFCDPCGLPVIFRRDAVFAIWDRFPVSDGHALIITDRHISSWFEASPAEQQAIFAALEECRGIILDRYHPGGFNIGVNIGSVAGQTIPHLHVHLIPRYDGDVPDPCGGVRHVIPSRGNYLRGQARDRPAGWPFARQLARPRWQ